MNKDIKILLLLVLLPFISFAQEEKTAKRYLPENYDHYLELPYKTVANWQGVMDLFIPQNAAKPTALVLFVHGGGWTQGSKGTANQFKIFFKKGYAVATIEYRLAKDAPAPAAVEDVRTALCFLLQNAKYNIDPSKVVLMGGSAGGHLALLAAYVGNDKRFDVDCSYKKPIKIAAVIDKFGITDVWDYINTSGKNNAVWLGTKSKDEEFAKMLSPLIYVKKTSPPTFIVHGTADPSVNYQHSVRLQDALKKNGVKNQFITVPEGKHGKFTTTKNAEINDEILKFLEELGI
ncbi:MAG: alpha/beta hydrolase [Flavobacteriales bacterium]|nr:MAG: alpha/beta hydrolase [Flavobacteriales bacterium]